MIPRNQGTITMTAQEVRAARYALGMTQDQLANALRMGGDGKRAVRRWEAGDRHISGPASVAIGFMLEAAGCGMSGNGVFRDQPRDLDT
jgi:transcriptional regulator with XRE-family HTH domain